MLPDFFIAGAAKSGTTSIYHYLEMHPEIYMSPIKEPNYFCTDINPVNFSDEFKLHEKQKNINLKKYLAGSMKEKHWGYFVTQKEDYEKLFKNMGGEKTAGEVSNSYLFSNVAAMNIRKEIPGAKIIIMLRNPVERAYSHYLANLRDGKTFLPFRKELETDQQKYPKGWGQSYLYIEMGFYYEQVKRYVDMFPAEQLKIYLFDDFISNTEAVMHDIFDFLGVAGSGYPLIRDKYNEAKEPVNSRLIYLLTKSGLKKKAFHFVPAKFRKKVKALFFRRGKIEPMDVQDRKYLQQLYAEDIKKLETLIHRDLGKWLM